MPVRDSQQMQEMFLKLFGDRPFYLWVFSASLQEAFLQMAFPPDGHDEVTGSMRGLTLDQQVGVAAGLHPTLLITFKTEVPNDVSHVDSRAFYNQLVAPCTFRADFFSSNALVRLLKRVGEGLADKHTRAGQVVQEPMSNGSMAGYWPLSKGDQLVVLYAGRVPMPDTRAQA